MGSVMNASVIQSMINAIEKPAIYITPDYVIQAVNQSYRETYQTQVVVGNSKCHQISHQSPLPCDQHGEECPLKQCQKTGKTASVVHNHKTEKRNTYCNILMKPVKDDDGITVGFLEILDRIEYASADPQKNKMIGVSAPFKSMLNHISRASQSDIAVLLQGDTGTGKELVAQALHDSSSRQKKPFVVIECTGLNDNLFESELFGYEKGAFTGATNSKKGLIEVANGGTVFFDEIGDVPLNMQVKLLRLIETQFFRAVGGLKQKQADFRLVCATHKNLLELVENGQFRKDLYYRIAGFTIHLPSLVERQDDIPLLARHLLKQSEYNHKKFDPAALKKLSTYEFSGNIRELKNIVEQAALMADEERIECHDLPAQVVIDGHGTRPGSVTTLISLDDAEARYLKEVCKQATDPAEVLAKKLGVSTRTFYRKLQRYGIKYS
ncbi:MAG: transcriptional regulator with PAS, ATPase and Fis domain [Paraglaciecola sp.]|jgi:transcriptional regulator with PAS, ATPase and Fis domain